MKQIINLRIIRKFAILLLLVGGVAYFGYQNNNIQSVEAAPCCSSCPGGGSPADGQLACLDQCGSRSSSCYNTCINQVRGCYSTCLSCGGGGGGGGGSDICSSNGECGLDKLCVNGICRPNDYDPGTNPPNECYVSAQCPPGQVCTYNGSPFKTCQ